MAIAAKRFTFLDKETNVPVSNFITAATSDILNSPEFDALVITEELQQLADANRIKDVGGVLERIKSIDTLGVSRLTKDFFSNTTILDGVTSNTLNGLTARFFPNDTAIRNAFNQVGEVCKSSILAALGNCKHKRSTAHFNGLKLKTNNRTCNLNAFVNLINRMTGGLYNAAMIDQCALARLVAGVALRGFQLGLPKVFSSIAGQIQDQYLLAQVGATVIGSVAIERNMEAVIDVATSSVGPMIPALNPGISSMVLSNYQIPGELKDYEIGDFHDRFSSAMTNMEPGWNSMNFISDTANGSIASTIPNLANMDYTNPDLIKSYQCSIYGVNDTLPSLDGEVPTPSFDDYILSGMDLEDGDTTSSLENNFDALYATDNTPPGAEQFFTDW